MEQKINIAELLKDCPSGMELYSPLFGVLKFVEVRNYETQIIVKLETGATVSFHTDGRYYDYPNAECILFPSKDNKDWSTFQLPFKDGDVISNGRYVAIFHKTGKPENCVNFNVVYYHCWYNNKYNKFKAKIDFGIGTIEKYKYATEEEKQKLFDAIKKNGYKWNGYNKTLEKLIEPKFKVGDVIQDKAGYKVRITDVSIEDECYGYELLTVNGIGGISFNRQDDWELVPNKFDVINFEPFMKVLARSDNSDVWECDFFSSYNPKCSNRFHCIGAWYNICIPYIGNEHLRGTTDDCDEYYKNWE